tara:strand:+ start:5227 stop:5532 length:306 start_codon:yes stop_codon:yes gene_type:complete
MDNTIIDQITKEASKPLEYISLETIVREVPLLTYETPLTYHLYINYNKNILTDEEIRKCMTTIKTLQERKTKINNKQAEYMDKNGCEPKVIDLAKVIETEE